MSEQEQKVIFSNNLKYYLERSGHSQKEVAEAIDVSPQTFNTWMRGIALPRMGKVEKLANYFRINKSDLIELSQNQDTSSDKVEWYTDPETAKLAQELHDNPDLRILLDAGKDLPPEKLRALIALITPHIGEDE